jgi:fucose permease
MLWYYRCFLHFTKPGIGATIAPILATLISRRSTWSNYYFITLGLAMISLVALGLTFRNEHSADPSHTDESQRTAQQGKLGIALRNKITWVAATFIFLYQGAEVALGGWLVTFMIHVLSQTNRWGDLI